MSTTSEQHYDAKILEMQKYLPMLRDIINNLKHGTNDGSHKTNASSQQQNVPADRSQDMHLRKMEMLFELLTSNNKKLKLETLQHCENILCRIQSNIEKIDEEINIRYTWEDSNILDDILDLPGPASPPSTEKTVQEHNQPIEIPTERLYSPTDKMFNKEHNKYNRRYYRNQQSRRHCQSGSRYSSSRRFDDDRYETQHNYGDYRNQVQQYTSSRVRSHSNYDREFHTRSSAPLLSPPNIDQQRSSSTSALCNINNSNSWKKKPNSKLDSQLSEASQQHNSSAAELQQLRKDANIQLSKNKNIPIMSTNSNQMQVNVEANELLEVATTQKQSCSETTGFISKYTWMNCNPTKPVFARLGDKVHRIDKDISPPSTSTKGNSSAQLLLLPPSPLVLSTSDNSRRLSILEDTPADIAHQRDKNNSSPTTLDLVRKKLAIVTKLNMHDELEDVSTSPTVSQRLLRSNDISEGNNSASFTSFTYNKDPRLQDRSECQSKHLSFKTGDSKPLLPDTPTIDAIPINVNVLPSINKYDPRLKRSAEMSKITSSNQSLNYNENKTNCRILSGSSTPPPPPPPIIPKPYALPQCTSNSSINTHSVPVNMSKFDNTYSQRMSSKKTKNNFLQNRLNFNTNNFDTRQQRPPASVPSSLPSSPLPPSSPPPPPPPPLLQMINKIPLLQIDGNRPIINNDTGNNSNSPTELISRGTHRNFGNKNYSQHSNRYEESFRYNLENNKNNNSESFTNRSSPIVIQEPKKRKIPLLPDPDPSQRIYNYKEHVTRDTQIGCSKFFGSDKQKGDEPRTYKEFREAKKRAAAQALDDAKIEKSAKQNNLEEKTDTTNSIISLSSSSSSTSSPTLHLSTSTSSPTSSDLIRDNATSAGVSMSSSPTNSTPNVISKNTNLLSSELNTKPTSKNKSDHDTQLITKKPTGTNNTTRISGKSVLSSRKIVSPSTATSVEKKENASRNKTDDNNKDNNINLETTLDKTYRTYKFSPKKFSISNGGFKIPKKKAESNVREERVRSSDTVKINKKNKISSSEACPATKETSGKNVKNIAEKRTLEEKLKKNSDAQNRQVPSTDVPLSELEKNNSESINDENKINKGTKEKAAKISLEKNIHKNEKVIESSEEKTSELISSEVVTSVAEDSTENRNISEEKSDDQNKLDSTLAYSNQDTILEFGIKNESLANKFNIDANDKNSLNLKIDEIIISSANSEYVLDRIKRDTNTDLSIPSLSSKTEAIGGESENCDNVDKNLTTTKETLPMVSTDIISKSISVALDDKGEQNKNVIKDNYSLKDNRIRQRRRTVVPNASEPIVNKVELLANDSVLFEDLQAAQRRNEVANKVNNGETEIFVEKKGARRLDIVCEHATDSCTLSMKNIITGKRRTRASINFNEKQYFENLFKIKKSQLSEPNTISTSNPLSSTKNIKNKIFFDENPEKNITTVIPTDKTNSQAAKQKINTLPKQTTASNGTNLAKVTTCTKNDESFSNDDMAQNMDKNQCPINTSETGEHVEKLTINDSDSPRSSSVGNTSLSSMNNVPSNVQESSATESIETTVLNEFMEEILKPDTDKKHMLRLLCKMVDKDKYEFMKQCLAMIETDTFNTNQSNKNSIENLNSFIRNFHNDTNLQQNAETNCEKSINKNNTSNTDNSEIKENNYISNTDNSVVNTTSEGNKFDEESGEVKDNGNSIAVEATVAEGAKGRKKKPISVEQIGVQEQPPLKTSKKKRSELDRLNEDIRDMFISQGVLTATGKRMCTLINSTNNRQSPVVEKNDIAEKEIPSRSGSALKKAPDLKNAANKKSGDNERNSVSPGRKSIRQKNKNKVDSVEIEKDSNNQSEKVKSNDEINTNSSNDQANQNTTSKRFISNRIKTPKVILNKLNINAKDFNTKYALKNQEIQTKCAMKLQCQLNNLSSNYAEVTNSISDTSNILFTSGNNNVTKNNEYISSSSNLNSNLDEANCVMENGGEIENNNQNLFYSTNEGVNERNLIKEECIKNNHLHWHCQSKYAKYCMICRKTFEYGNVSHYRLHHSENYVSRLAPAVLKQFKCVNLSKNGTESVTDDSDRAYKAYYGVKSNNSDNEMKTEWYYRCPFCMTSSSKTLYEWMEHFRNHTAEYRYECSNCFCGSKSLSLIQNHIRVGNCCKALVVINNYEFEDDSKDIKGHVCHLCNFIQLQREHLDRHYVTQHLIDVSNVASLGNIIILLDTYNVEVIYKNDVKFEEKTLQLQRCQQSESEIIQVEENDSQDESTIADQTRNQNLDDIPLGANCLSAKLKRQSLPVDDCDRMSPKLKRLKTQQPNEEHDETKQQESENAINQINDEICLLSAEDDDPDWEDIEIEGPEKSSSNLSITNGNENCKNNSIGIGGNMLFLNTIGYNYLKKKNYKLMNQKFALKNSKNCKLPKSMLSMKKPLVTNVKINVNNADRNKLSESVKKGNEDNTTDRNVNNQSSRSSTPGGSSTSSVNSNRILNSREQGGDEREIEKNSLTSMTSALVISGVKEQKDNCDQVNCVSVNAKPLINIMRMEDLLPDSPCNDPIELVPELGLIEPLQDLNDLSSILNANLTNNQNEQSQPLDQQQLQDLRIEDALDFINEQQAHQIVENEHSTEITNANNINFQTREENNIILSAKTTNNKISPSIESKAANVNCIQNIGYTSTVKKSGPNSELQHIIKFYCLVNNCSFLYSSDPMGLENHFRDEHKNIMWSGFCKICQKHAENIDGINNEIVGISHEIKHMVDVHIIHIQKYLFSQIKHRSQLLIQKVQQQRQQQQQPAQLECKVVSENNDTKPRIKIRRLTGDCLSSQNSTVKDEVPNVSNDNNVITSDMSVNNRESSEVGSTILLKNSDGRNLLGALLNAKQRPPTIEMPPEPLMQLTEPLLLNQNHQNDLMKEVMEESPCPLQITNVMSLHEDALIINNSEDGTSSFGQSSLKTVTELQKLKEIYNITRESKSTSVTNNQDKVSNSESILMVSESIPLPATCAGNYLITQTVSAQYDTSVNNEAAEHHRKQTAAQLDINISRLPLSSAITSTQNESTKIVDGILQQYANNRPGETSLIVDNNCNASNQSKSKAQNPVDGRKIESRLYRCMDTSCRYSTRIPEAIIDHLKFHEMHSFSGKQDYLNCSNCLCYIAGSVENYMTHAAQCTIESPNTLSHSSHRPDSTSSSIVDDNRFRINTNEYKEMLQDVLLDISQPNTETGSKNRTYRCVDNECAVILTESDFCEHIGSHHGNLICGKKIDNRYHYRCPYCTLLYQKPTHLKNHVRDHVQSRFICYLCEQLTTSFMQMVKHFSDVHGNILKLSMSLLLQMNGERISSNTNNNNSQEIEHNYHQMNNNSTDGHDQFCDRRADDNNEQQQPTLSSTLEEISDDGKSFYIVYTHSLKQKYKYEFGCKVIHIWRRRRAANMTTFKPCDIDLLPMKSIFPRLIYCGLCNYGTKVRTNLHRHLLLHLKDEETLNTGKMDPVNPVPCLNNNEKFFDKMTNLASGSVVTPFNPLTNSALSKAVTASTSNKTKGSISTQPEEEGVGNVSSNDFIALDLENSRDSSADNISLNNAIDNNEENRSISSNNECLHKNTIKYAYASEKSGRYRCGINGCNHLTISEINFRIHLMTLHNNALNYTCLICNEEICKRGISTDKICTHLKYHGPILYRCDICNYQHYMKSLVERHINDHHAISKTIITKHERANDGDMEGVSEAINYCGKGYRSSNEKTNSSTTPYTDNNDNSRNTANTSSFTTLDLNLNSKVVQKYKWVCDLCNHLTGTLNQIQNHCQSEHGQRMQYQCVHCNFGAGHLSQVLHHVDKKHEGMSRQARHIYHRMIGLQEDELYTMSTRPLWLRNDPNRIRHIRGILVEDEHETEERLRQSASFNSYITNDDDDDNKDENDTSQENDVSRENAAVDEPDNDIEDDNSKDKSYKPPRYIHRNSTSTNKRNSTSSDFENCDISQSNDDEENLLIINVNEERNHLNNIDTSMYDLTTVFEYGCYYCDFATKDLRQLKVDHFPTKHNSSSEKSEVFYYVLLKRYCCPRCRKFVGNYRELSRHMEAKHRTKNYCAIPLKYYGRPPIPNKSIQGRSRVTNNRVRSVGANECGYCSFSTNVVKQLMKHHRTNHQLSDVYFDDEVKMREILAESVLNDDNNDNGNSKSRLSYVQCNICYGLFANRNSVITHACEVHPGVESFSYSLIEDNPMPMLYKCPECPFVNRSEKDTYRHMIEHYPSFSYCHFCHQKQKNFIEYMDHCYSDHRDGIRHFKTIYPFFSIKKFLQRMNIISPNGLILKKIDLISNGNLGTLTQMYELYEQLSKTSQQPPIPRLSLGQLVARHDREGISRKGSRTLSSSPLPVNPPNGLRISKRRPAIEGIEKCVANFESELILPHALEETTSLSYAISELLNSKEKPRNTVDAIESGNNQEEHLSVADAVKLKKRRCTISVTDESQYILKAPRLTESSYNKDLMEIPGEEGSGENIDELHQVRLIPRRMSDSKLPHTLINNETPSSSMGV